VTLDVEFAGCWSILVTVVFVAAAVVGDWLDRTDWAPTTSSCGTSAPSVADNLFFSEITFICRFRHLASKASCRCCGDRSGWKKTLLADASDEFRSFRASFNNCSALCSLINFINSHRGSSFIFFPSLPHPETCGFIDRCSEQKFINRSRSKWTSWDSGKPVTTTFYLRCCKSSSVLWTTMQTLVSLVHSAVILASVEIFGLPMSTVPELSLLASGDDALSFTVDCSCSCTLANSCVSSYCREELLDSITCRHTASVTYPAEGRD